MEPAENTALRANARLGRYVLETELGQGAAGVVWRAFDTAAENPQAARVALKVIHPWLVDDKEVRARFRREIVLARRVVHDGVCRIHDFNDDDDVVYLAMDYVEGQTLAVVIHAQHQLTPAHTLAILEGLTPSLAAAHAAGVVHRDLKPGNIMVKATGQVMLLDFGMATADDVGRLTKPGRTVGSLRFIAPEVWEGRPATVAADVYAVGVILYACLSGRLPYDASTPAEMFAALKHAPQPLVGQNPAVTPAIEGAVRRAMSRDPDARPPSIVALLDIFSRAVTGQGAVASETLIVRPRRTGAVAVDGATLPPSGAPAGARAGQGSPRVPRVVVVVAAVLALLLVASVVAAFFVDIAAPLRRTAAELTGAAPPPEPATGTAGDVLAGDQIAPLEGGASANTSDVDQALRRAAQVQRRRGLLRGDVPEIDQLLERARTLVGRGRTSEAYDFAVRAERLVLQKSIDRGLIVTKQKRLRLALEAQTQAKQQQVKTLDDAAQRLMATGQYAAANDALNRAFALMASR